jgi:NADH:ubiquinone oxidoreductase subunit 6 (subunit J)
MAYIGCILFGLIFVVMTAQSTGSLQARMEQTFHWIHSWAPFSYLIILIIVVAPFVSVKIMNSWPKRVEPEDPMAKYRRQAAQGLEEAED